MRQYCSDIKSLAIVMDRRNQADFIAANIEYRKFTHLVCRWKAFSHLGERLELRFLYHELPAG
jgi:hypothetical protein